MSTEIRSNRRTNPDGMKGHTDVTTGTETRKAGWAAGSGAASSSSSAEREQRCWPERPAPPEP